MRSRIALLVLSVLLSACHSRGPAHAPRGPVPSVVHLALTDWALTQLGGSVEPRGADAEPLTLHFDIDSGRAAGFAGCNRWNATYRISTDRLSFGGPVSTRKHCEEVMATEDAFLAMLSRVIRYELGPGHLTLYGVDGELARFRPVER